MISSLSRRRLCFPGSIFHCPCRLPTLRDDHEPRVTRHERFDRGHKNRKHTATNQGTTGRIRFRFSVPVPAFYVSFSRPNKVLRGLVILRSLHLYDSHYHHSSYYLLSLFVLRTSVHSTCLLATGYSLYDVVYVVCGS